MSSSGPASEQPLLVVENEAVLARYGNQWSLDDRMRSTYGEGETLAAGAWAEIDRLVEEFITIAATCEPFDVIELARRHEFPSNLESYEETRDEGSAVAVELVALLLRVRSDYSRQLASPSVAVPRLVAIAREILDLIGYAVRPDARDAVTVAQRLADSAFTRDRTLRGNQFEHIERDHNRQYLSTPEIEVYCREFVGITADQLLLVIDALDPLRVSNLKAAIDEVRSLETHLTSLGLSSKTRYSELVQSLSNSPGRIASFTAMDLARFAGISEELCKVALELISVPLGSVEQHQVARLVASGNDPMRGRALVSNGERFSIVNPVAATDRLRWIFESKLKTDLPAWSKYSRNRGHAAEDIAMAKVQTLLDSPPRRTGLEYFANSSGGSRSISELTGTAPPNPADWNIAEADGIFVFESVAVIVEVKAGALGDQSRRGSPNRLVADLKKTLGDGATQARRLEELARTNGGVWLQSGDWLDLADVTEVHKVVASAEEFGISAVDIESLASLGIIEKDSFPWLVSLHDLSVIAEVCENPAAFLLYLRRRTAPHVAKRFVAIDELDLFMLFLRGQYQAIADPRVIAARNPKSIRPTKGMIRSYEAQSNVFVTSQTDDLASWIYFRFGRRFSAAPKPALKAHPQILRLVQFLQEDHKPGWLEFGADLLDVDPEGQKLLVQSIDTTVARSARDGLPHSVSFPITGYWGNAFLGIVVQAANESPAQVLEQLELFVALKKHQLGCNRALGAIFTESGELVALHYMAGKWAADESVDRLARGYRLKPHQSTTPPPYARRKRRRLR